MDGEATDRGEVRPVALDRRKRSRSPSSRSRSGDRRERSRSPSSRSRSGDRRRSHSAKRRKEKRRKRKKKSKKRRKEPKAAKSQRGGAASEGAAGPPERPAHPGAVVTDEQKARIQAMRPMTKEEWEARQSVLRHVVDPETGRKRLIKGDGEVLEEIVSRERHREINKHATKGDGFTFQVRMGLTKGDKR